MNYVKSIFAGMEALVLCAFVFFVVSSIVVNWNMPPGSPVSIDVISWIKQSSSQTSHQLIGFLVFIGGFYSKLRRVPK